MSDLISRAAAIDLCSEWLRQYVDVEITFTSARQHASDAVMDIRDLLHKLPAEGEAKAAQTASQSPGMPSKTSSQLGGEG